jgi:CMP-N-acetylneuraminic acid synthetase
MKKQVGPWALVPARGGSKSIPKKNIVSLDGRPMMEYGILAAKQTGRFERIVCSTDDAEIAACAEKAGIEVDWRPAALATDEAAVADVAREFLQRHDESPELLALIQPTSPFLLPAHVAALLDAMAARPDCNSGQTITPTIHNSHAWNQRLFEDGIVRFMFAEERRSAFNKQRKPKLFSFGNLVAARPAALLAGMDFFAEPSVGVQIDWPYNLDVDSPNDLKLAEAMMHAGLIKLDYLQS